MMEKEKLIFDFENDKSYTEALSFIEYASGLVGDLDRTSDLRARFLSSANAVVVNIAKGKGKLYSNGRFNFIDEAIAAAYECFACLDILNRRKIIPHTEIAVGKEKIARVLVSIEEILKDNSKTNLSG